MISSHRPLASLSVEVRISSWVLSGRLSAFHKCSRQLQQRALANSSSLLQRYKGHSRRLPASDASKSESAARQH